jgi:hypothetical protein
MLRKLLPLMLLALACKHQASTMPPELAAYSAHLKLVANDVTTSRGAKHRDTVYNVDQTYEEALAALEPMLKSQGYTAWKTAVPKYGVRICSFRKGAQSIALTDDAHATRPIPGWSRVTLGIDSPVN